MAHNVSNTENILDSRDIIARLAELTSEREDLSSDELEEFYTLRQLAEDGENSFSEWHDGVTLIRDDHFETYAREFAEDIGTVSDDATWPNNCIDWTEAARELQVDYSIIEFDGEGYWGRS